MSVSHNSAGQRQHPRKVPAAGQLLVAHLICADLGQKSEKQLGIVLNLSEGGMALQPFRSMSPDCIADFRVALPEVSGAIAGRGQVAWKRDVRVGLRFVDAPLADSDRFREWLHRRSPDQKDDSALAVFAAEPRGSEFDTALRLVAYNAMVSTGASGAAIALEDSQGMECRASVGNAPEVGAPLRPDAGLSGLCLRTGKVVSSNDVRADQRVDPLVARTLDLRSLVIMPIAADSRFAGLLEVFSERPQAFNGRHLEQLQCSVRVLSQAIQENEMGHDSEPDSAAPVEPEKMRAAQLSDAALDVALQDAEQEANANSSDSKPLAATAPVMAEPVAVSTNSVEEIESEESTHKVARAYRGLHRPLFMGASLGAAILLAFALWPRLRTSTLHPQSPAGQSVRQNAPSPPSKTTISLYPSEIVEEVGARFTIDVMIHDAKNASSVPLQVFYNPEKLQIVGVSGGNLLQRDGHKIALVHKEDAAAGRINIAASCPPTAPGISGDGTFVTLAFLSKVPGRSRLRVNQAEIRDPSNGLTLVNGTEALVNVSPSRASDGNQPAKAPSNAKGLRAEPVNPDTSSTPPAAPAAPVSTESKPAPDLITTLAPFGGNLIFAKNAEDRRGSQRC